MSYKYPTSAEYVVSFNVGGCLIEDEFPVLVLKCLMKNQNTFSFVINDKIVKEICSHLTDDVILKMVNLAEKGLSPAETQNFTESMKRNMADFQDMKPDITSNEINNPPFKTNGVVGYHLHIFEKYIALELSMINDTKKTIALPMILAGPFRNYIGDSIKHVEEYSSSKKSLLNNEIPEATNIGLVICHCTYDKKIGSITSYMHEFKEEIYKMLPYVYTIHVAEADEERRSIIGSILIKTNVESKDADNFRSIAEDAIHATDHLRRYLGKDNIVIKSSKIGVLGEDPLSEDEIQALFAKEYRRLNTL